jgi:hypothetical protein
MLELLPTWQFSHPSDPSGIWFPGVPTSGGFIVGIANAAAFALLWHCAQFPLVDGAFAWIAAIVGMTERFGFVWHAEQAAPEAVGM